MTNRGNKRRLRDLQSLSQKGGGRRKTNGAQKGEENQKGAVCYLSVLMARSEGEGGGEDGGGVWFYCCCHFNTRRYKGAINPTRHHLPLVELT